jgi:hypothetical protein
MHVVYLKVKIKSLAAEASIIRKEEHRRHFRRSPGSNRTTRINPDDVFFGLYRHRVGELRTEARAAQLAYGYLRGREYTQLEAKCDAPPIDRVTYLAKKYGPTMDKTLLAERIATWLTVAEEQH